MDGNVLRVQPLTPAPYGVQQPGQRDARKDAPPFDLEKEAKGEGQENSQAPAQELQEGAELPAVAQAGEDESGRKLDVLA